MLTTSTQVKTTKSFCPKCYQEIEARVYREGDQAVMKKKCLKHGEFKTVVEKDYDFYKKAMSVRYKDPINRYVLIIPATYKCNLKCKYCYLPSFGLEDLTTQEIKEMINNSKHNVICFSGGEPTVREDLTELIKYAKSKGKQVSMLSNCIKLKDKNYVKQLKNCGIDCVVFSFNSSSDYAFERIERKKLLEIKRQAFKNVKRKIKIYLSFSWLKGVNDSEFKNIFKLALKNNCYVKELRCRSFSMIGRCGEDKKAFLSEFIQLLSEATNIPIDDYLDYWPQSKYPSNQYRFCIDYYDFIFNRKIAKKLKKSIFSYPRYLLYLNKHLGFKNLIITLFLKLFKNKHPKLKINFFRWPDKFDVDLDEIINNELDHVAYDKSINPFYITLFQNDKQVTIKDEN